MIGSPSFNSQGGGSNFLCLPFDPDWLDNDYTRSVPDSKITSVEYISGDNGLFANFNYYLKRAECALCQSITHPTVVMIPAKTSCPSDWKREYYGYLMSSGDQHNHSLNYICVISDSSYLKHADAAEVGGLAFVRADCSGSGNLKECSSGKYANGRQLTCVVCSK